MVRMFYLVLCLISLSYGGKRQAIAVLELSAFSLFCLDFWSVNQVFSLITSTGVFNKLFLLIPCIRGFVLKKPI